MSNPTLPPEEKRFKPGQSGNPKGRPKGLKNATTYMREAWERMKVDATDPKSGKKRKMPPAQIAVYALIQKACKGDIAAFESIINRMDGRVTQTMEMTGKEGSPLVPPIFIFEDAHPERKAEDEQ